MQRLKSWMLPLAMLGGAFFYEFFQRLAFLTPYLIFSMLFITYCRLSFKDLRFSALHGWLLLIQTAGSMLVYAAIAWYDPLAAQGIMICVLAPTATAAAVITGMLGGNVACLAAYTLISSLTVAVVSPVIFSWIGARSGMPFGESLFYICRQVMPLLVLPFVLALTIEKVWSGLHRQLKRLQVLSFYLWVAGLTIVTGKTVFFMVQQDRSHYAEEWFIALLAFIVCVLQFLSGRFIGGRYGDKISGGQGLGQKNTILAIWMAQTYLSPLASIGPAAYVLWQNIINSWQLWKKRKDGMK